MLISEYRPLFTQPFNLRRYEADAARQAAAEAARAEAGMPSSPLLTPIRCERLSVMAPEGLGSPFGDCCATPLAPESPVSAFLAAAMEQAGASAPASPAASQSAAPQPAFTSIAVVPLVGSAQRGGLSALQTAPPLQPHSPLAHHACEADAHLEQTFSSLLESTVSGMLFGCDMLAAEAALAPAPAGPVGMDLSVACRPGGTSSAVGDADMQPMSPVAVLPEPTSDGGDTSDGSGGCLLLLLDVPVLHAGGGTPGGVGGQIFSRLQAA